MAEVFHPDRAYVFKFLEQHREAQRPWHTKMKEIEALRYFEDKINLPEHEKRTGIEFRAGLTAELIDSVKGAILANLPRTIFKAHRDSDKAKDNTSDRENFWNEFIGYQRTPVPIWDEFVDAMVSLGAGILKVSHRTWPTEGRTRKRGESTDAYRARMRGLKKMWGPPISIIGVHPMSVFFEPGVDNQIEEIVEHSWKSKAVVYGFYGIKNSDIPDIKGKTNLRAVSGLPEQFVRPFPAGVDSSTMVLTTEYTSKDWYQVYLNGKMVYEEQNPSVKYILGLGKTNSSQDPDKLGVSVAEFLRNNERTINRTITRMAEAVELIVQKRLTLELPEGSIQEMDEEGKPKVYEFTPEYAESLPPGSRIQDPYTGVEGAFNAMPLIQLMLQFVGQHGVSPIFKGIPPGAAGSGYRDNSLYLMAMTQFAYLVQSYQAAVKHVIAFCEWLLVHHIKQEMWMNEFSLSPASITEWPATLEIDISPEIPQNLIAEGSFWARMKQEGYVDSDFVREKVGVTDPSGMQDRVDLEASKGALLPYLIEDVLRTVLRRPTAIPEDNVLVGPDGRPIRSDNPVGGPGARGLLTTGQGGGGLGQTAAGEATGGQPRQPVRQAGETV